MRVKWNKQSKEQLIRAASYIRHEFGHPRKRKPLPQKEKRLLLMLSSQP